MNETAKQAFIVAVKRGKVTKETTLTDQYNAILSELRELKESIDFSTTGKILLPDEYSKEMHEICIKDTLEGEIVDSILALSTMAEMIGMDLERHIDWTLKYNAER
jgi:hypothetical protein